MIHAFEKPIYITQPLLPDMDALGEKLKQIWESHQLSNNGEMVKTLEKELATYLGCEYLSVFSNGTVALQLACRLLRLSGEVITTPFTFAATVHSLRWSNLEPVFCDIDPDTYNINPDGIEALITEKTTAILPVHVFGTPCDVERIQKIADKHGLKVLYDAAHAFGVKVQGKPISAFGDCTMFSFHATKIFHTIEGGALSFKDPNLKERADSLRNFGIRDLDTVLEPGTNGKLNEIQAAVGLLVLKAVDEEIAGRKEVTNLYRSLLKDIPGIVLLKDRDGFTHNYPYFCIRVLQEEYGLGRDALFEKLKEHKVLARKYFYPLCSNFQCYSDLPSASKHRLPVANEVADSILALPLHGRMQADEVALICKMIKSRFN